MKILEVHNLYKKYRQGNKFVEAVLDVSLSIHPGEVLAFLGPNGAGKTTSIKMIAGLIRPDTGSVRIGGCDPHRNPQALRMLGAVLEGSRNLYWRLTPLENLEYFGVLRGISHRTARKQALKLLEQFELTHKRNTPVQTLSRGMQQKLAIAVALVHKPSLLLLDEPTLGLDIEASQHVKAVVRHIASEGCAILLTTHQLDVAEEISDQVAVIRQGKIIAQESTEDIIQRFSGSTYIVKFEGELEQSQITKIKDLSGIIEDRKIIYPGTNLGIYQLLTILKPLNILEVKQDRADLTQVFLKLLREHSYA